MSVSLVWATPDADRLIADMARVSSPQNVGNDATRLISYLIRHRHWSPFEMAAMCVSIRTTRDIGRQILRHRSFKFQEFCVSGDTVVTFDAPKKALRGRRMAQKHKISDLWEKWHHGAKPITDRWNTTRRIPQADRIRRMKIRVFDEASRQFTTSSILGISQTGVKPTFRVTLENGKAIECTKEHKFLTADGFVPLEDAIGLELIGKTAVMTKPDTALACNGVAAYTDRDWLHTAKLRAIESKTGLVGIATDAGCTTHTIRKWLKHHKLQFTKLEVKSYTPSWNKGKSGYRNPRHSLTAIEKMRASAKRGPASNLWRGGADRAERLKIADWCNAHRAEFLNAANHTCAHCRKVGGKLELHHIKAVVDRPDLAREPSNISVLCHDCHAAVHNLQGDRKQWRERSRGNTLTIRWSKVRSVEYVGEQMTYDLEVEHASHNYVGNGIVVHNSQRYAATDALPDAPLREARLQDVANRQSSMRCDDDALATWWEHAQADVLTDAHEVYAEALRRGIAKEQARAVLPEGLTSSHLYMHGDLRSWLHYCALRRGNGTQAEHRAIATAAWDVLRQVAPACVAAFEQAEGTPA